jgi:DNA-binding LacI/PurR family transcriptional regulator
MAQTQPAVIKPATIRDVARAAGVGLGTVSRVINDSPSVSIETRQRVQQVIDELHFVPNPTARRLSSGKTLDIAVIVPFFTRPSVTERLRGIESMLSESEYDLIIYNVETAERRDACMREISRKDRADGVIIISLSPRDSDLPFLLNAEHPIVLVDANHDSLVGLNRVIVDDVAGGRLATQHLIDLGHRRIAYISDTLDTPFNFTSSRDRLKGYQQTLQAAGIPVCPEYHLQDEHGRYEAYRMAMRLLRLPDPPTAIFSASDTQAMGVLQAARELDLAIPDDLSVIGYDDIEVAEYLGLTTIRQMLYESGQRGVELLLEILETPNKQAVCEVLPTELIVRATTAPPRGD